MSRSNCSQIRRLRWWCRYLSFWSLHAHCIPTSTLVWAEGDWEISALPSSGVDEKIYTYKCLGTFRPRILLHRHWKLNLGRFLALKMIVVHFITHTSSIFLTCRWASMSSVIDHFPTSKCARGSRDTRFPSSGPQGDRPVSEDFKWRNLLSCHLHI
jgi:hypothetical protein